MKYWNKHITLRGVRTQNTVAWIASKLNDLRHICGRNAQSVLCLWLCIYELTSLRNLMPADLQLTPEMYNQLRGLQKKAKDLRQEVRNLRRMSQAQAHSVRETIRDTFLKIRWAYMMNFETEPWHMSGSVHVPIDSNHPLLGRTDFSKYLNYV